MTPMVFVATVTPAKGLSKDDTVINAVDLSSLSLRNITLLWAQGPHKPPHLELCTSRPRITACSSVPPPINESLPLPKSLRKAWKR